MFLPQIQQARSPILLLASDFHCHTGWLHFEICEIHKNPLPLFLSTILMRHAHQNCHGYLSFD